MTSHQQLLRLVFKKRNQKSFRTSEHKLSTQKEKKNERKRVYVKTEGHVT